MKPFDPSQDCNAHVAKLKEYRITSQEVWRQPRAGRIDQIIKADWNEAGIEPSPKVLAAFQQFFRNEPLHWYPDVEATDLRQKLAAYCGCQFEQTQVFSGSDAALEYFCRAFLNPEDEVILRTPTYDNFRVYAQSMGATITAVKNDSPFSLDLAPILEAISPKTKIVYLVNPDNPTGVSYSTKELEKVLEKAAHALVVSDEAYFEFHGHSAVGLLTRYPNLVVSRSFSKAFALAGLRIGYLVADAAVLAVINKIRVGKNVNSLAQLAALAALDDPAYLEKYVTDVRSNRAWLCQELTTRGFVVQTTTANFIMVKVDNPTGLASHLKNAQIYIRDRSYLPQLEGYVRITVGTRAQAEKIVAACQHYLELNMVGL